MKRTLLRHLIPSATFFGLLVISFFSFFPVIMANGTCVNPNCAPGSVTINVPVGFTGGTIHIDVTANGGALTAPLDLTLTPAGTPTNVSGTISASPNPCTITSPATQCTSNITWSTTNATAAQVWVTDNAGAPSLFGSATSFTNDPAPWIQAGHNYNFTLYDYSSGSQGNALASVSVTANSSSGGISASPNPCSIVSPATSCSSTISWNSSNLSNVQVWMSDNGGAESNFASTGSGAHSQSKSGIISGHTYLFTLYDYSSGSRGAAIGSVSVSGQTSVGACGNLGQACCSGSCNGAYVCSGSNICGQNVSIDSLTVSPSRVSYGGQATLTYTTTNAATCTATSGNASGSTGWSGSRTPGINQSALVKNITAPSYPSYPYFTLSCTDSTGTLSTFKSVSIILLPDVFSSTTPATVSSGGSSTNSWWTRYASSCTATSLPSNASWTGAKAVGNGKSQSITNIVSSGTFTLKCGDGQGDYGYATSTVTLGGSAPTVISFTATPSTINTGATTTLAWACGGGATSGAISPAGLSGLSGSQVVSPVTTTTYTLTCSSSGFPDATAQQIVTVTSKPDLSVSIPSPSSAVAGTPLTFSALVSNTGTAGTGTSFSNLFQVCNVSGGCATPSVLSVNSSPALGSGGSGTVTSSSYTFPSSGTYSVRVCTDNNASFVGTVDESDEGNNCGGWTDVAVNPAGSCIGVGTGTGLTGEYYDGINFASLITTRIDGTVNFDPADFLGVNYANSPDGDTFSVRWEGQVQPTCSENYTFYSRTDDGGRLWVNGNQVVNQWVDQAPLETASAPIALVAGTKYDIKMEYYENGGGATAQLSWSSPSTAKQIIPQSQLYPLSAPAVPVVSSPTATSITSSSATLGANVTSLGNPASISARGTCWGTSPAPVTNCTAEGGTTTGVYTQSRSAMPTNTTIYYRGYATNSTGTGYSTDGSFTTSAAAINGTCGTANGKAYPNGTSSYGVDTQCSNGNSDNTAFPAAGSTVNWTCSGQNGGSPSPTCSASQDSAAVTTYSITINKSIGGYVTSDVGGINCGSTCSQTYTQGTTVNLTPHPASIYWKFIGWTTDCTGSANPYSVTVNSNKTCSAVFAPVPFQYQEF